MARNVFRFIVLIFLNLSSSDNSQTHSTMINDFVFNPQQNAAPSSSKKRDLSQHYPYQRYRYSDFNKGDYFGENFDSGEQSSSDVFQQVKPDRYHHKKEHKESMDYSEEAPLPKSSQEKNKRNKGVSVSFGADGPISVHLSKQNGDPNSSPVHLHVNVNKESKQKKANNIKVSYSPQDTGKNDKESFELEIDKHEQANDRSPVQGDRINWLSQDYNGRIGSFRSKIQNYKQNLDSDGHIKDYDYTPEESDNYGNSDIDWKEHPAIGKDVSFGNPAEDEYKQSKQSFLAQRPVNSFRYRTSRPVIRIDADFHNKIRKSNKQEMYFPFSGLKRNADTFPKGDVGPLFGGEETPDANAYNHRKWNVPFVQSQNSRDLGLSSDLKTPYSNSHFIGADDLEDNSQFGQGLGTFSEEINAWNHYNNEPRSTLSRNVPHVAKGTLTDDDIKVEIRNIFHFSED